jgi:hypothetical protein
MLALAFTMTFPSLMSWLEFIALPHDGDEASLGIIVVFALAKVIQFGFPLMYVLWVARERIQLRRPTRDGVRLGVVFAAIVAAGMYLLYFGWLKRIDFIGDTPVKINEWLGKINCASAPGYLAMAAFVSIPHSLLEEYYWRWFVFGRLERIMPLYAAIALSSLAFMGHHVVVLGFYFPGRFWIGAVPFSLCVAGGGAVWAWMYHRTQNLYAPWISHLLIDLAIMGVGYDMVCGYW